MITSGQKRSATDSSQVDTDSNTSTDEDGTMVIDDDGTDRTGRNIHDHDHDHDRGQSHQGPVNHNGEKESHLKTNIDDASELQEGQLTAIPGVSAEDEGHQPSSSSPSKRPRVSSDSSASTRSNGDSSAFTKKTNDVESGSDQTIVAASIKDVTTNGSCDPTPNNPAESAEAAAAAAKLDLMPSKALETILEFLDVPPRELFVLVTSIKPFYDAIQSRPDIVVKNAFMAGKNPRKIVSEIVTYLEEKTIHVPNTNRMLRLINGEHCERGEECFGYNLITGQSAPLGRKEKSKRPCGLCLCEHCVRAMSVRQQKIVPGRSRIPEAFKSLGVIVIPSPYDYYRQMLRDPVKETCTGTQVGPLLTSINLSQMMIVDSPPRNPWRQDDTSIAEREAYQAKLQTKVRTLLDTMIKESNSYDQDASKSVLWAHEAARVEHRRREQEAWEERERRRKARLEKRKEVLKEIMDMLNELGNEYNWLFECSLEHWCSHFHVKFVDNVFGPLLGAPSKFTKQKLATAVMDIVTTIGKLEQATLLPLPGKNLCSIVDVRNEYERSLIKYYRENYKMLLPKTYGLYGETPANIDAEFFRLALSGSVVEALEVIVKFVTFFSSAVSSNDTKSYPNATMKEKCDIATIICRHCSVYDGYQLEQHSKLFNFYFLRSKYRELLDDLEEFRNSTLAKDFIEGHHELARNRPPTSRSYRRNVVNSVFAAAGPGGWHHARFISDKFIRIRDLSSRRDNRSLLMLLLHRYELLSIDIASIGGN